MHLRQLIGIFLSPLPPEGLLPPKGEGVLSKSCFLFIILCLICTTCEAQSFFNSQQNQPASSSKVMSPDEYKNMMQNLQKQNQPAPQAPVSVPQQATTPDTSSTAPVTTPAPTEFTPSLPPATQGPQAAPAKASDNQTYTGFINPNDTNTGNQNTHSGTNKSSGWNIQY